MQGSDDPTGERRAAGGDPTGETRSAALATAAVVAGVALVAAGILAVATEWRGVPGRPAALVRLFTPPPVRIGVPVAALGAAHGGASRLSPVPVSPTCRQRRTAVAGALVAAAVAAAGARAGPRRGRRPHGAAGGPPGPARTGDVRRGRVPPRDVARRGRSLLVGRRGPRGATVTGPAPGRGPPGVAPTPSPVRRRDTAGRPFESRAEVTGPGRR